MASAIGRNLHLCFSMIKRPTEPMPSLDLHRPNPTATTSSSSTVFVKNFNSLFDFTATLDDSAAASNSKSPEPDFAAAAASRRFFVSRPGRSNSITDSGSKSDQSGRLRDSVAVPTYSPDPYADFRRSMQEMVEARGEVAEARGDWEYLHELLLCYLALNPKSAHKFIIGAFSDLLVSMMPPLPERAVRSPIGEN